MIRKSLDRHLRLHGCFLNHHETMHDIWVNPRTLQHAPLPKRPTIKHATAKGICRVLGIAALPAE